MTRDRPSSFHILGSAKIIGKIEELGIQPRQQLPEGVFAAAVRRSGNHDKVGIGVVGYGIEQIMPLVPGLRPCASADMGFIDNNEIGLCLKEFQPPAIRFDKIQGTYSEPMTLEQRFPEGASALQSIGSGWLYSNCVNMELLPKLRLPLFH